MPRTRADNNTTECLPLHPQALRYFHDIEVKDISTSVTSVEKEFQETLDQIIDSSNRSVDIDKLVADLGDSYREFTKQKEKSETLSQKLTDLKREYKEESAKCEKVTFDTWKKYQSGELTAPNLLELYHERFAKGEEDPVATTTKKKSNFNVMLKLLPHLWKDPTAIIPDDIDTADTDDLQINGGNIELICPITVREFEHPMISKQCGHVFDKVGLTSYFGGRNESKNCPQGACSKMLMLKDFEPDPIMAFRCKIARVLRERKDTEPAGDELDVL
ncbi:SUMO ligase MMS21 KNAG_0H01590 [Huiozyma naganishii CBS 8797]|uniref:SP-RING-type domain-containing protein n=1 Tax=Huiozyma naganishii (strain ATCC MYA-139 / BCRC 22969 / CBS 8797 / KCTC 17520 / NBRC 10181 / NCYC 3082 / Yp74L-3) TaxID=1071383 RepID=J7RPF7_HUIN7|nr:hypothetical protein KNAG_0H01590 [Kazachstania naganishii CBS 8797]CCK71573.1 hypothetical protein KNAG_0H01590 [Kazachstania naganishii CBS 8797]